MSKRILAGSVNTGKIWHPVTILSTRMTDMHGRAEKATLSSPRVAPTTTHWYCFITLRGKILLQCSGTRRKVSNRSSSKLFT